MTFLATDSGDFVMLVILDLTAALISRLEQWVGITGIALEWFWSYPANESLFPFVTFTTGPFHKFNSQIGVVFKASCFCF